MIIHIRTNIAQEDRGDDTDGPKRCAGIIHVLVALGVSLLASQHNHVVGGLVAGNAGDGVEEGEERGARVDDGVVDVGLVEDVELGEHGVADELGGVGDELFDEDIVVDAVAWGGMGLVCVVCK